MPLGEADCLASYKVLMLGETSVGKTSLIKHLVGRDFRERMVPTVGVDFVKKIFEVDGALVQLAIWDTAGLERFRSITRRQYTGVQGILLVYDITNSDSFNHLAYWITSIQYETLHSHGGRGRYEPIPIILCGNKLDIEQKRQVQTAKGRNLAEKEMAFEFFETSAKTGNLVYTAFQRLAYHVTDIHDPKLMKSYHPYMMRTLDESGTPRDIGKSAPAPAARRRRKQHKPKTKRGESLFCGCLR